MCDFGDDAASEGEYADHEDGALDDGDPLAEAGAVLLHGEDDGTPEGQIGDSTQQSPSTAITMMTAGIR